MTILTWEPFKEEKIKETGKEFPVLELLFKQSDDDKKYPFDHNPVVDDFVNEPKLSHGLDAAIEARIREESRKNLQKVPDGYMKKLFESNISLDEKEKHWPEIVEEVKVKYGFRKVRNKDNTKFEWQWRETANLKKLANDFKCCA